MPKHRNNTSGYVYVLTNEAMPGLVKIGRSNRSGRDRATAIDGTGVPRPFELAFECFFDDCIEAEVLVHEKLQRCRPNPRREFFQVDVTEAQVAILEVCAECIDHTVVHADFKVCEGEMAFVAYKFGLMPPDPYLVAGYISDDGWKEAIATYKMKFPGRITMDGEKPPIRCEGCTKATSEYAEKGGLNLCEQCFCSEKEVS